MSERPRILLDHVRKGKRLIPPFVAHFNVRDVSWEEELLPDLAWVGAVLAETSKAEAMSLCLSVAKFAQLVAPRAPNRWFAGTTSFAQLTPPQWAEIRSHLRRRGYLRPLATLLCWYLRMYPESPLSGLLEQSPSPPEPSDIVRARSVMTEMLNRYSVTATMAQGYFVYAGFVLDMLKVRPDLTLAKFPEIEHYPNTDISKRVASAVRASVNSILPAQLSDADRSFLHIFRMRNRTLVPCRNPLQGDLNG